VSAVADTLPHAALKSRPQLFRELPMTGLTDTETVGVTRDYLGRYGKQVGTIASPNRRLCCAGSLARDRALTSHTHARARRWTKCRRS
jgi:hypothetical protein